MFQAFTWMICAIAGSTPTPPDVSWRGAVNVGMVATREPVLAVDFHKMAELLALAYVQLIDIHAKSSPA